eukprot:Pompholyxophrys_punicea_v1_NODE_1090_length_969_cov_1.556893.p2 type:complete len:112 gc:universal NODE_1090_length_969_cov_1.556893:592-257(-)
MKQRSGFLETKTLMLLLSYPSLKQLEKKLLVDGLLVIPAKFLGFVRIPLQNIHSFDDQGGHNWDHWIPSSQDLLVLLQLLPSRSPLNIKSIDLSVLDEQFDHEFESLQFFL